MSEVAQRTIKGRSLPGVKAVLTEVFTTAAALRSGVDEHKDAIRRASLVPREGFLFKLVALESGVFIQIHDLDHGKTRSYQPLPAGSEFYAASIQATSMLDVGRTAMMLARRPDRPTDHGYQSPLIIASDAFDIRLFPESEYEPTMNYEGRFGPGAPKWQRALSGDFI